MGRGRLALRRDPRAEHLLEEVRPAGDERQHTEQDDAERDEEPRREQVPPVGDREHREAAEEAEQAAPREGRELHDEEKREQHHQRGPEPVAALESQVEGE